MNQNLFGYDYGTTWVHQLNGSTKMFLFLIVSIIAMMSYDTRFIIGVLIFSLFLFFQAHIKWRQIRLIVKIIIAFSLLNLITVFLFSPQHGVDIYGTKHILFGSGYLTITAEQLFYEINLALKYIVMVPLALTFLITTNPSEFAASLNKLGLSYRISYAVSLSLRYIPDIQSDYQEISLSQQARGYEMSKKGKISQRLKGTAQIIIPLIFTSLDRIEVVSRAMELRRFGHGQKRSWYMQRPMKKKDWIIIISTILILLIGILFMIINNNRFYNPFI